MNLNSYHYSASKNFLDYEFYSEGRGGAIKKVVRFSLLRFASYSYYNLGFGDWNESKSEVDDSVVSNNRDAERVLATVASVIVDFFVHYPDAYVYFEGSPGGRTRRYQMGINKYWHEITISIEVYGLN